jgi:hypothetical protein
MKTIEYYTIDKSKWGQGEWSHEPDKVQWQDKETSLPCLAVRHHRSGHWCGYVGVANGHPYFQKDYNDCDVGVHGGLTFASLCDPEEKPETGVCHIPGPGEDDHVWWLGFDCAHYGDLRPEDDYANKYGSYKDLGYVKHECKRLARQLYVLTEAP